MKKTILIICMLAFSLSMISESFTREELAKYASSLYGKKKGELKTAIYKLCQPKSVLNYGAGIGATWSGFVKTDRVIPTLECLNRYSTKRFYFSSTSSTSAIDNMNIEHSFPKSWWGGTKNQAYKDLFNLYPAESDANSKKSNYPMGKVTTASLLDDYEKVGYGTAGSNGRIRLCEPNDKWKGDFCRSYFYMATIYQNLTWEGTQGLQQLENNTWPTLQEWAYTLYLEWTRNDKVADTEVIRNNAIHDIQGNRNLFIDFPYLSEYVWGDSIDVSFDPYTSLTTASDETRYETKGDGCAKCAKPEITYTGNKLTFACTTPGASVYYTITPSETTKGSVKLSEQTSITLLPTFTISCYAIASGYDKSETATKDIEILAGDVNGDGKIDINDVSLLVKLLLNK